MTVAKRKVDRAETALAENVGNQREALTTAGRVGVKVWIYRGDKLLEGRSDMDYDDAWELRRDRLRERERARAAAQRRREAAQSPSAAEPPPEVAPPPAAMETAADGD